MGFYGMLLGLTLMFSFALMSNVSHRASMLGNFSNEFDSYRNIQRAEAFKNMIESTRVQDNSTEYGGWLNSLYVSARIDGMNLNVSNGIILISTKSKPAVYAVLRDS